MTDQERQLVQRIIASPHDVSNWLVWADYVQDERNEVEATEIRIMGDPTNDLWRLHCAELLRKYAFIGEPPEGYKTNRRREWEVIEKLRCETALAQARLIEVQLQLEKTTRWEEKSCSVTQKAKKRLRIQRHIEDELTTTTRKFRIEGSVAKWEEENADWKVLFAEQRKLLDEYGQQMLCGPVCKSCGGGGYVNHRLCEDCCGSGDMGGLQCYHVHTPSQVANEVSWVRGTIKVLDTLVGIVFQHTRLVGKKHKRLEYYIEPSRWALNMVTNHMGLELYSVDRDPEYYPDTDDDLEHGRPVVANYAWVSWNDDQRTWEDEERYLPRCIFGLLKNGVLIDDGDVGSREYQSMEDATDDLTRATTLFVRLHILSLLV